MPDWLPFGLLGLATLLWPPGTGMDARWVALTGTRRLADPGVDRRARRRLAVLPLGYPAAGVLSVAAALTSGWALGLSVLTAGCGSVRLATVAARRRRRAREARSLREAVRLVSAELSAGATVDVALSAGSVVGPPWQGPLLDAARSRLGEGPVVAYDGSDERLRPLFAALEVGAASGAPLGNVLARVEADLAVADARRRDVSAVLAGPRSSALLLAFLPVVGVALGVAMGAGPVTVLLRTGPGRLLLCFGIALDVAGVLWTMRLVRRAEPP